MIRKEDLTYSYNHKGYTIFYKGKSIGGAKARPSATVMNTEENRAFYKRLAENAISGLLAGRRQDLAQNIPFTDEDVTEESMLSQVDAVKSYAREVINKFPIREPYVLFVDSLDNGYFRVFAVLKWREVEAGRWLLRAKIQERIAAKGYKAMVYIFYEHEGMPSSEEVK